MTTITNTAFAAAIGRDFTMASRLRNGERKPGLATVIATVKAYSLTCEQVVAWLEAIDQSAEASGAWLRDNIFSPPVAQAS